MTTLEQRLQDEGTPTKMPGAKVTQESTLEKALAADDAALASELNRTRAEEIIALRRQRINSLNRAVGQTQEEEQRAAVRVATSDQSITDIVKDLLDRGMDPERVGRMADYLMGSRGPSLGFPGQPVAQGLTFDNALALFDRMSARKESDPALTSILNKLTDDVKELKERVSNPPQPTGSVMVQQKDGTFVDMGKAEKTIIIPRAEPASDKKSVDEIREEHRHDEEKEKLAIEKANKETVAKTFQDIAVSIGDIAADYVESKGGAPKPRTETAAAQTGAAPQQFKCEECGTMLAIPVGTKTFTCPKCKTVYDDKVEKPPEKTGATG